MRRAAANANVLLKNENGVLPIRQGSKKIAVFGQNASRAVPTGGGSASLTTSYVISPLDGIVKAALEIGATVDYQLGAEVYAYLPLVNQYLVPTEPDAPVGILEFWLPSHDPGPEWLGDVPNVAPRSEPDLALGQESADVFPFGTVAAEMALPGQCNRVSDNV